MFAFRRGRMPFLIPLALAVAFGYLLAGGIGSAIGVLLFIPILIMKVLFTMMFFGFLFKMFAHRSGFAHRQHHGRGRGDRSRDTGAEHPFARTGEREPEDRDWEEALRAAKREIDKLFPNPRDDAADRDR